MDQKANVSNGVLTGPKMMSFLAKGGNPKNNLQRLLDIIDSRLRGNDILVIHATKPCGDEVGDDGMDESKRNFTYYRDHEYNSVT